MIKEFLPLIFSQIFFKKLFTIFLLGILLYFFRDFGGLFLITFIFAYLSLEIAKFLQKKIFQYSEKTNNKCLLFVRKYASINILVSGIYIFFVIMLIWLVMSIFPKIASEIEKLLQNIPKFTHQIQLLVIQFETATGLQLGAQDWIQKIIQKFNFQSTGQEVLGYIRDTGGVLIKFMIGLIMSYIFLIDREDIFSFFKKMKKGNFAFIYEEFEYISNKIIAGFGRVFKAQGIIAIVNAILTTIGLLFIGHLSPAGHFPYIFTLSLIVLIFGFIPVFGTFLSGLPIIIIGYGVGGIPMVIAIMIMIALIHAIEAYILNPKIVSSYMHFPVFITFATLIIAEHLFGVLGLLIGVPLLSIIISVFADLDKYISTVKQKYAERKKSYICKTVCEKE